MPVITCLPVTWKWIRCLVAFTSWATGYADFRLVPDLTTLRIASWLEKTAIVLCDVCDEEADIPVAVAPRNILKKQLDAAKSVGYSLMGASEPDLYVFDDSYAEAKRKNYHDLKPISDLLRTTTFSREQRKNSL